MGSFNNVCAISGLEIFEGDDVKMLFLVKTDDVGVIIYSHYRYQFIGLPIDMRYCDYANYNVVNDGDDNAMLSYFKKHAVEDTSGGEYSIKVIPDEMTLTDAFDAIHEGRLFVKGSKTHPEKQPVEKFPVLTKVYDKLMKFDIVDYYDNIHNVANHFNEYDMDAVLKKSKHTATGNIISHLFEMQLARIARRGYFVPEMFIDDDILDDMLLKDNIQNLDENVLKCLEVSHLHHVMNNLKMNIVPPMSGSQEDNYDDIIKFSAIVTEVAVEMKNIREELYGEDEEELEWIKEEVCSDLED